MRSQIRVWSWEAPAGSHLGVGSISVLYPALWEHRGHRMQRLGAKGRKSRQGPKRLWGVSTSTVGIQRSESPIMIMGTAAISWDLQTPSSALTGCCSHRTVSFFFLSLQTLASSLPLALPVRMGSVWPLLPLPWAILSFTHSSTHT